MALGPGKYDDECKQIIRGLEAQGVVLCVAGGLKGHGFSAAFRDVRLMATLPNMLREVADAMEKDAAEAGIRSGAKDEPSPYFDLAAFEATMIGKN